MKIYFKDGYVAEHGVYLYGFLTNNINAIGAVNSVEGYITYMKNANFLGVYSSPEQFGKETFNLVYPISEVLKITS